MGAVKSFAGGLLMTLALVVVVPVVCNEFLMPYIADAVGDSTFLLISSDMLVNLIMWTIILGFMVALGSGLIFKRFGVVGIIGLIAAYFILGDVTQALVPLLMLILTLIIFKTIEIKRNKKSRQMTD